MPASAIQLPVFVYDRRSPGLQGFDDLRAAEAAIEPNDVDEHLHVYDATGRLLEIVCNWQSYSVTIVPGESTSTHTNDLREALAQALHQALRDSRRWQRAAVAVEGLGLSESWIANASVEELIATFRRYEAELAKPLPRKYWWQFWRPKWVYSEPTN